MVVGPIVGFDMAPCGRRAGLIFEDVSVDAGGAVQLRASTLLRNPAGPWTGPRHLALSGPTGDLVLDEQTAVDLYRWLEGRLIIGERQITVDPFDPGPQVIV